MRTVGAFAGAVILSCAAAAASDLPTVAVSARAEVSVPADSARLTVAVEKHAASAAEAATQVRVATNTVLDQINKLGLQVHAIQSEGYTVSPDYDYQANKLVGYGAKTTVALDVRDVGAVGKVIDVVMAAGVTSIHEVRFLSQKEEDAYASALRSAVAAATRRATVMAEAAGGRLGELLNLSTEPEPGLRAEAITVSGELAGVAGTNLPPAEVRVHAVVYGTWRYVPMTK
jgi:uncharacterized protein YggE